MICTESKRSYAVISEMPHQDNLLFPIRTNEENLAEVIKTVLDFAEGENIHLENWAGGRYAPTLQSLKPPCPYTVVMGWRTDASAINLSTTTDAVLNIIVQAKAH